MPYVLLLGFYESRYSAEEFMKKTTQPSDFWKFQKNSWNRRVLKKKIYLKFSKNWMSSACQVKDWKADFCAKGKIFQQCRPNIEDTLTIWRKMFSPALNRFLKRPNLTFPLMIGSPLCQSWCWFKWDGCWTLHSFMLKLFDPYCQVYLIIVCKYLMTETNQDKWRLWTLKPNGPKVM